MSNPRQVVPFRDDRGRQAPRLIDLDLEAQVIGAVLYDNAVWRDVLFLEKEDFSDNTHAELWAAISTLQMSSRPATPATVAIALGAALSQMGGRDFLTALCGLGQMIAPAIADAAERLRRHAQWRRLTTISVDIQEWARAQDMTPDEAFSAVLRQAEGALQSGRSTARTKREVATAALAEMAEPRSITNTGIDNLDYLMHGGLRGCLIMA
jgi:replicative DNA helicase